MTILLALAEQGKKHGYSVLAVPQDVNYFGKFHRVPSQGKKHGYSVLAIAIVEIENFI